MQRRFLTCLRTLTVLFSSACFTLQAAAANACDLNADGAVNTTDVNLAIGMSTGAVTPCTANIIGSGVCNVVMVQRVINASMGASCGRTATLSWTASTSANVTGYKIYRSTVSGSSYALVSPSPVAGTSFADTSVQGGTTYYYVVTAVDAANNESGYSAQVSGTVPSP